MDNVNNPAHYGQGNIEAIEYIEDFLSPEEYIGYLRGNIAKYQHRWRYKNGIEDLKKAQWYQDRLINFMEKQDDLDSGSNPVFHSRNSILRNSGVPTPNIHNGAGMLRRCTCGVSETDPALCLCEP